MIRKFECQSAPVVALCSTCGKRIEVGDRCVVIVRYSLKEPLDQWGPFPTALEKDVKVRLIPNCLDVEIILTPGFSYISGPVVTRYHWKGCGVKNTNTSLRQLPGDCGRGKGQ